jgi:hypothetical protein
MQRAGAPCGARNWSGRGSVAAMLGGWCLGWSSPTLAQEGQATARERPAESRGADESELAMRSQNPIEDLVNVPVEDNLGYGVGSNDRAQNTLKFEPRIPARVLTNWNIVTRIIIPLQYKPDATATTGGSSGLGDINPTFFLTPAHPGTFVWGAGPDFELPTATQKSLGTGKWSVGPAVAWHVRAKPWTFAMVISNIWSFAGESGRSNVDKGSLQYFVHYNLSHGWSLKSTPTVTAEWNKPSGQVWTVPVGAGVAKLWKMGKLAIHPGLAAYGYPAKPSDGPDWDLRAEVAFLFPP